MKKMRNRVLGAVLVLTLFIGSGCFCWNTYVSADTMDAEFVSKMKEAGFPDSYLSSLNALHAKYPKWQFEAVNTGLEWSTVIEK